MSQMLRILNALDQGEKLTPIDALNRFGCFRLGARIYDLRRLGHNITKTTVERGGKKFACYYKEGLE